MTTGATSDLQSLQRKLDYLLDRSDILDCVARYARGVDRHDPELLVSAYHPDAVDIHGNVENNMEQFAAWANALHDATFKRHTHCLTTHNCEIDGHTAHTETYVVFGLLTQDGKSVWLGAGRYVDRLEKRAGTWRIALRKTTVEWMVATDTQPMQTRYFIDQHYIAGVHGKADLSYQRPLQR